jgi:Flp pilus assembly protein TadD
MSEYHLSEQILKELHLDFRAALAETLVTAKHSDEAIQLIERDAGSFPGDAVVHHTLGHLRARLGQWDQAAAAYTRSLELNPSNSEPWYCAAAVYLWAGDLNGYRRACAGMIERFEKPDSVAMPAAERTVKSCAVVPNAVDDFKAVERLAERMIKSADKKDDQYRYYLLAKGLVDCRGGHFGQAVQWLGRFAPKEQGSSADATAFSALSIAKCGLGDKSSAKSSLEKAQAIIAQKMPDPAKGQVFEGFGYVEWLHCRLLAREAEDVLKRRTNQTTKP